MYIVNVDHTTTTVDEFSETGWQDQWEAQEEGTSTSTCGYQLWFDIDGIK